MHVMNMTNSRNHLLNNRLINSCTSHRILSRVLYLLSDILTDHYLFHELRLDVEYVERI